MQYLQQTWNIEYPEYENINSQNTYQEYPEYEDLVPQDNIQVQMVDWSVQNTLNHTLQQITTDQAKVIDLQPQTIRYINGNVYVGQLLDGLRHGNGSMHFYEGSKFEGNYQYGLRQGPGKLSFSNGAVIQTIWVNDMMNGEGTYVNSKGQLKNCIFHNNSKIELDNNNQSDLCYDCAFLQIILTICIYILVLLSLTDSNNDQGYATFAGIFYLLNLVWGLIFSRTSRYIFNTKKLSQLRTIIHQLKQAPPNIQFNIQCYHYVNEDSERHESNKQRKVVTIEKIKKFKYQQWCDRSSDIYSLDYLQTIPYARLHISKTIEYSDQASNSRLCQRNKLYNKYKDADEEISLNQTESVDGYKQFLFIVNDYQPGNYRPMVASKLLYVTSTFLCLNFINRIMFIKETKRVDWELNKYIIS